MKKLKLLLAFCALLLGWSNAMAQFTDVTSTYITNPSFETDDAISDLKSCGWATDRVTGWTILPASPGNAQVGVGNSSSTIQGIADTFSPSDGDKYFYMRENWNPSTTFSISQTIASIPAGCYRLSVKIARFSSVASTYKLSLQEENETAVTKSESYAGTAGNEEWQEWSVLLVKKSDETPLTITASYTTPSENSGGKHYAMLLDDIRLEKADYYVTPIANNTTDLYFKNEKTGQFLSAGHSWGTHATVDNYGQEITATVSEGIYSLKTQQYNAYLNNLYMDNGTSTPSWLFLETAASSGKYYMTQDGTNFMTSNGAGAELVNVTSPTDASVWTIVSKADRKTALSSATIDSPIDATFLLPDPNFGRNNVAYSNWTWTFPDGENKNNAGKNENFVVECYHKQFTFKTTLAAGTAPAGVYGVTAQGFYRQDGEDNDHLPVFYVNSEEQTFPARTGSEGSMDAASESFSAGSYTIDPIYIRIENEDAFEVGAKLATNTSLWCIWDNFQLKYYGDVTVAAVKMKASVDAYNAAMDEAKAFTEESMFADAWTTLQSAITTNTLDLNDPSLTESALNTATANLVAANADATAAVAGKTTYNTAVTTIDGGTNVDLTGLITNPGFEVGSTTGWTNSGTITANAQNNSSFDNKQGSYYAERWHVAGTIDINQTVKYLPAGIYKVEAYLFSDVADAKFYVNSENVSVSTSQKYFAVVEISDKGSIKMGASCTLTNSTWICLDDYKLTYLASSYAALPYTLATGKMGTDKATAQTDAEDAFEANPNMTTYEALLSAIADAEASKANYDKLKAAIDKANDVIDNNNFVTAAATTAFQSEIDDATEAWTDVTYTDAECTTEIATLGTTVSGWHAIDDSGKAGAFMASTWGKTHENWWTDFYINTWSTEGDNDGSGFSVPFFEYYTGDKENLATNTFTATLTGLDNGVYEVELWARAQRRSDADFNGDNSMITMNVNGGDAVSIMSDTEHNVGTGGSVMRLGRYTATGIVTDGTLTLSIDVKLGSNVHWLCWRDVTYTKVAPATVSATIGSTGWTTFSSPYALNLSSMTASTGSVAAYYASSTSAESVTVLPTESSAVQAGEGLLLKGTANATITIPVVASGEAIFGNLMVGCPTATNITSSTPNYETCYVLGVESEKAVFQNVENYIDGGKTVNIPAGKAYLNATASNGARSMRIVFSDITGVDNVEAAAEATLKDGKYLENGKIVIVKNGQKFNANGQQVK